MQVIFPSAAFEALMSAFNPTEPAETEPLVTLYTLLWWQGVGTAVVATAIEEHGLYGFDRFGRFRVFTKKDNETRRALDAVESVRLLHIAHDQGERLGQGLDEVALSQYGWPLSKSPDFHAIAARLLGIRSEPEGLSPKSMMLAVGGLLRFIQGEFGFAKHGQYKSQDQLAKDLELYLRGTPVGLSESSWLHLFADVNKLMADGPSKGASPRRRSHGKS